MSKPVHSLHIRSQSLRSRQAETSEQLWKRGNMSMLFGVGAKKDNIDNSACLTSTSYAHQYWALEKQHN